jgi:hypothetical protein
MTSGSARRSRDAVWRIFASSRSGVPAVVVVVLFLAASLLSVSHTYHQPFSGWDEPRPVAPLVP